MMDHELLQGLLGLTTRHDRFYGVVIGIVTNNRDPENMHRVKVRFPWLSQEHESNWARVASSMTGNDRGAYFLPEVDDEVLVAFEHGSIDHPYVIGALWNGKDKPPESNGDGQNNHRTLKSRSGHVIRLNDKAGDETIEIIDKNGNKLVISAAKNSISVEAQGDITLQSGTGKVTIKAATGIELQSQTGVSVQAGTSLDLKANGPVTVKGAIISLN